MMEIESLVFNDGKNRLVIEKVESNENQYRVVWRGNSKSVDGFVVRPAHFEWEDLGKLIRKGFLSGKIKQSEINDFTNALLGVEQTPRNPQ